MKKPKDDHTVLCTKGPCAPLQNSVNARVNMIILDQPAQIKQVICLFSCPGWGRAIVKVHLHTRKHVNELKGMGVKTSAHKKTCQWTERYGSEDICTQENMSVNWKVWEWRHLYTRKHVSELKGMGVKTSVHKKTCQWTESYGSERTLSDFNLQ